MLKVKGLLDAHRVAAIQGDTIDRAAVHQEIAPAFLVNRRVGADSAALVEAVQEDE